ncbi:MAG: phosphatase PAP2 family protein [Methyloprofundus sp.]|nr:phosphatase PAP2 family protein [Methyloprofundus sp.]
MLSKSLQHCLPTLLITLVALLTLFLKINHGELDLSISRYFYKDNVWFLAKEQPWLFFYNNDKTLLLVTFLPFLILLTLGFLNKERKGLRKYAYFILSSSFLTAGFIVNWGFKDFWGRWRPKQTVEFGGEHPFYSIWEPAFLIQPESIGQGASFSSGHPTSLLIAICVYFVFKNPESFVNYFGKPNQWKVKLLTFIKYTYLYIAILGGFFMGLGRVIQGAHFASDVLWSYVFVFAPSALLYYYVFKLPLLENQK